MRMGSAKISTRKKPVTEIRQSIENATRQFYEDDAPMVCSKLVEIRAAEMKDAGTRDKSSRGGTEQ